MNNTKIICERCGKEIKETNFGKVYYESEYGYVKISKIILSTRDKSETVKYDFCADCMRSYFNWLGGNI